MGQGKCSICWQMVMKCVQVWTGFALKTFQVPDPLRAHSWNALLKYKYVFNKHSKYLRMPVISVRKYLREHNKKESTCPFYSNGCVWDSKYIIEVTQYHTVYD